MGAGTSSPQSTPDFVAREGERAGDPEERTMHNETFGSEAKERRDQFPTGGPRRRHIAAVKLPRKELDELQAEELGAKHARTAVDHWEWATFGRGGHGHQTAHEVLTAVQTGPRYSAQHQLNCYFSEDWNANLEPPAGHYDTYMKAFNLSAKDAMVAACHRVIAEHVAGRTTRLKYLAFGILALTAAVTSIQWLAPSPKIPAGCEQYVGKNIEDVPGPCLSD